jgi:hypothetical protein
MPTGLINIVSRKEDRAFVISPSKDSQLSSQDSQKKLEELALGVDVRFEQLKPLSPSKNGSPRGCDSKGNPFVRIMTSSSADCFIQESPQKLSPTSGEVRFRNIPSLAKLKQLNPAYFENPIIERFEFTVDRETIDERSGKKRPCSQLKAFGCTAKDKLKEHGAILLDEENNRLRSLFHLAHRQGWGVGGAQDKANLDPATAGSNYATLLRIEDVLIRQIKSQGIQSMKVEGQAIYHPELPIPMQIIYTLKWGNARELIHTIEPLNRRIPVLGENIVANAMFALTRSPAVKEKISASPTCSLPPPSQIFDHSPVAKPFADSDAENQTNTLFSMGGSSHRRSRSGRVVETEGLASASLGDGSQTIDGQADNLMVSRLG